MNESTYRFPARLREVPNYLAVIDSALPEVRRREEVIAGLAEALSNAIVHGALGISSDRRDHGDIEGYIHEIDEAEAQHGATRVITLTLRPRTNGIEAIIADEGAGFDWRHTKPRKRRGLSIVLAAFDQVQWNAEGNTVMLLIEGGTP